MIAANRFSVGSDSSGMVSKLASDVSVSVCGSGVRICGSNSIDLGVGDCGLVVAAVLHRFLKLNALNGDCSIVGSVTMLLCNSSGPSSELPGEQNVLPCCVIMFCSFRVLASRDGARVWQLNLCYNFVDKLITNQAYLISHHSRVLNQQVLLRLNPFKRVSKGMSS